MEFLKEELKRFLACFGVKLDLFKFGQIIFTLIVPLRTYCYSIEHEEKLNAVPYPGHITHQLDSSAYQ